MMVLTGGHCASLSAATSWTFKCLLWDFPLDLINRCKTFGDETFTWTIIGAKEVFMSCAGWLIVSASRTTSCKDLASSKILSISLCTSAKLDRVFERSIIALLLGLFRTDLLAREMSAVTLVIDILPSNLCFRKSKRAFCIMSVTLAEVRKKEWGKHTQRQEHRDRAWEVKGERGGREGHFVWAKTSHSLLSPRGGVGYHGGHVSRLTTYSYSNSPLVVL